MLPKRCHHKSPSPQPSLVRKRCLVQLTWVFVVVVVLLIVWIMVFSNPLRYKCFDPREWPLRHFWVNSQVHLCAYPHFSSSAHKWLAVLTPDWDSWLLKKCKSLVGNEQLMCRSPESQDAGSLHFSVPEVERKKISLVRPSFSTVQIKNGFINFAFLALRR